MVFRLFSPALKNPPLEAVDPPPNKINNQIQVSVDQLNAVVEQMKLEILSLQNISTFNQESMHQLKIHSEKTNDYTQKVKEKMVDIESSSIQVSTISNRVLEASTSSEKDLQQAFNELQSLKDKIEVLQKGHQKLLEQMDVLVQHSIKTIAIVDTIGSISQKTRILSLNASIEAARAGLHGKGFNVVANEVGKLANLTADAVSETSNNIKLIQEEIMKSTVMVKEESKQVEDGANEITHVIESFYTLKNKLHHIQLAISEANTSVGSQTANISEITPLLNDISNMSIENTSQVYQVSKELDNQHTTIEEIVNITNTLTNTSDELQHLVKTDELPQEKYLYDSLQLESIKNKLNHLLLHSNLHNLDPTNHQQTLNSFIQAEQDIEAIWSNRSDGTFIYSNPTAGLLNAKVRPWFKHAIEGEIYTSEVYTSALTKQKCITISCPIRFKGEIYGVIGVDLSLRI